MFDSSGLKLALWNLNSGLGVKKLSILGGGDRDKERASRLSWIRMVLVEGGGGGGVTVCFERSWPFKAAEQGGIQI